MRRRVMEVEKVQGDLPIISSIIQNTAVQKEPTFESPLQSVKLQLPSLACSKTLTEQCSNKHIKLLWTTVRHSLFADPLGNKQCPNPCPKILILLLCQILQ